MKLLEFSKTFKMPLKIRSEVQLPISERKLLLLLGDLTAAGSSVLLSLLVWSIVAKQPFTLDFILSQVAWLLFLPFLWMILANANDFYNLRLTSRVETSFPRLIRITGQLLLIYLVLFFLSSRDALPRLFILYYAVFSFIMIGLWRSTRLFLIGWTAFRRRALIVGTGWAATTIARVIAEEANNDYELIGYIGDRENIIEESIQPDLVLGTGKDLPLIAQKRQVVELIIAHSGSLPGEVFQAVMACYEQGITVIPMPLLYEQITGRMPMEHVGQEYWAVVLPMKARTLSFNLYLAAKRTIDILLSGIGLTFFALLIGPLALAMKLDSTGPIFYTQERIGRGGQPFQLIKLRSMVPDAERDNGPQWATSDDPRVTRIGRFLRKTRLDEVPQLLNILKGEMSLIGPRPERPVFVNQLSAQIPFYRTRHLITPGLTGWAQVCYRYGNTVEDAMIKLQYDLYYIRHQSLGLDLQILWRTAGKVLAFQGV